MVKILEVDILRMVKYVLVMCYFLEDLVFLDLCALKIRMDPSLFLKKKCVEPLFLRCDLPPFNVVFCVGGDTIVCDGGVGGFTAAYIADV